MKVFSIQYRLGIMKEKAPFAGGKTQKLYFGFQRNGN